MDRGLLIPAVLLCLAGCAPNRPALPPASDLAGGMGTVAPETVLSGGMETEEPPVGPRVFTRDEIRERILGLRVPTLAAEARRFEEALGRRDQAALWPNPELEVMRERMHGDPEFDEGLTKVWLGQRFELGGKRAARTEQAEAEAVVIFFRFQDRVRRILRDADALAVELLRLREEAELADRESQAARQLAALSADKYAAGGISLAELNKSVVAAEQVGLDAWSLAQDRERARRRLDDLLDLPPNTTVDVAGDLAAPPAPPPQLAERLARHPRAVAAAREVIAAERTLARHVADAWPDVTIRAEGMRDYTGMDDEDYYGFGFALPIPIFDRRQGFRAEALATIARAVESRDAEVLSLAAELEQARVALDQAAHLVAAYDTQILPRLEETYQLSVLAFDAGKASQLETLDSFLLLVRARRARLGHVEALWRALAEIEYLTGWPEQP